MAGSILKGRITLVPLSDLDNEAWRRVQTHFRDPEIAHLNGTPPNRMPLWLLKRVLKADSRRSDRETFGILDEAGAYIGTVELYDIRLDGATMGIIIGEKSHWNRGYGPEAMEAMLYYGFETLGLSRIQLSTFADNPRAQAAFRKVGFRELRRARGATGRIDVHMELTRSSWRGRRESAAHHAMDRRVRAAD